MPQVKKPYGLVYNTDGSLCVTYRDDDIPFPGVRSFAVEEATTNYWNNDITDYAYKINSGDVTFENTVYNGRPALKCIVTGTDPFIRIAFKHSAGNINPGDTYTASIGVAALNSEITGLDDTAAHLYFTKSDFSGFARPDHNWGKAGNRIYATYTRPIDGTDGFTTSFYACVFFKEAGTFYLYDYQLEKKPFATSFVDGSRPNGNLRIPVDLASMDDFVLSFWVKMNPYYLQDSNKYFSIGDMKDAQNWNFDIQIRCYSPDLPCVRILKRENGNLTYSDIYEEENLAIDWAMITFVYDDGIIKLFYNGQKAIENSFIVPNMYGNNELLVGHPTGAFWPGQTGGLGLISNLYTGKYRKPNGEIIWTDDYIREVYEAKIPFPVSNKLSIY